jgi:hypothetical protein
MTVAELENSDTFERIDTIDHQAMHAWIRPHLFSFSVVTAAYWLLNCAVLAAIAVSWSAVSKGAFDTFAVLSMGMCGGLLLLLPVHEHLHALAYRITGASKARVIYDLRRLTALCIAPNHVVSGNQLVCVALAPFVVLNTTLAIAAFLAPAGALKVFLLGGLLMHVAASAGDIAFVQYVWLHRRVRLYTYDDADTPQSFFYRTRQT